MAELIMVRRWMDGWWIIVGWMTDWWMDDGLMDGRMAVGWIIGG